MTSRVRHAFRLFPHLLFLLPLSLGNGCAGDDEEPFNPVVAWGSNQAAAIGAGAPGPFTVATRADLLQGLTVTQVAAGANHTVALLSDGTIRTFGDNRYGQLGDGTFAERSGAVSPPVLAGLTVTAVAAGAHHSISLLSDGTVRAWGKNDYGQVGVPPPTDQPTPIPVAGLPATPVTAVTAGGSSTTVLLSDGTLRTWGRNDSGQLGNGTKVDSFSPVSVALTDVLSISQGSDHTLAIVSGGAVKSWGENSSGQLGNGNTTDQGAPVTVPGLTAAKVSAGYFHSFAILNDGAVKAWGWNGNGQLGDGTQTNRSSPVPVTVLAGMTVSALAGDTASSFALLSDGTVLSWGRNNVGQLGHGTLSTSVLSPVAVLMDSSGSPLTNAIRLSVGVSGIFAIRSDGALYGWGSNGSGELGNREPSAAFYPVTVPGFAGHTIRDIATGNDFTLVLRGDGKVVGWGENDYGQLGDGTTSYRLTPVEAAGLSGLPVVALAAGLDHAVALLADGTVRTWGMNDNGQLGDGTTNPSSVPVTVPGLSGLTVTHVAAGRYHTLVRITDGTLRAWGRGSNGQLGHGLFSNSYTPVTVITSSGNSTPLSGVTAVSGGGWHTVALLADGTVRAWGDNDYGYLGDDSTTDRNAPVLVVSGPGSTIPLSNVVQITASGLNTMALLADGTIRTWGENSFGQIGDGTTTNRSAPTIVPGLNGVVVKQVESGYYHSLALLSDGTVRAWGYNLNGQLGNGHRADQYQPVEVSGLTRVTRIVAMWMHTIAIRAPE